MIATTDYAHLPNRCVCGHRIVMHDGANGCTIITNQVNSNESAHDKPCQCKRDLTDVQRWFKDRKMVTLTPAPAH